MEEYQDPKVKTTRELVELADVEVARAHDAVVQYERSRRPEATEEERFNEGRHGRTVVEAVSAAQSALTQLGMRVRLQLDGRDQARARQLDRILGIGETMTELDEVEGSTFQERVTDVHLTQVADLERSLDVPEGTLRGDPTW